MTTLESNYLIRIADSDLGFSQSEPVAASWRIGFVERATWYLKLYS